MELNIIYINLDRCKDRRVKFENMIQQQQQKLGSKLKLVLHRFNAIDGGRDNIKEYIEQDDNRLTKSEKAVSISHILSMKYAQTLNVPYVMICEDDTELHIADLYNSFYKDLNNRPHDLDCWQLAVCCGGTTNVVYKLISTKTAYNPYDKLYYCAGCYIITTNGIKNILDKVYKNNRVHFLSGGNVRNNADFLIFGLNKTYTSSIPYALSYPAKSTIHEDHHSLHKTQYSIFKQHLDHLIH